MNSNSYDYDFYNEAQSFGSARGLSQHQMGPTSISSIDGLANHATDMLEGRKPVKWCG